MKIFRIVALLTIVLCCTDVIASDRLVVVYTNSLNGYLDFCHCRSNPRGGLVKRATEFRTIRKEFSNALFVDTGDNFTYEADAVAAPFIVRALKHLDYDAMVPGDQEFALGAMRFMELSPGLPYLCNNLSVKRRGAWDMPFRRYTVIGKGNVKAAVIGSIARDTFRFYPGSVKIDIAVKDQLGEIRKDIGDIGKKGIEFIVLLSHSGYERDMEIARAIPSIDLIIGGHSQTLLKNPVKAGNTVIVQAGADGAHIGILELAIEDGAIVSLKNSFRRPDEFRPADDPFIRRLINDYRDDVKKSAALLRFK